MMDQPPAPTPEVSVVMPVHNAAAFVAEAIASVRAQRFGDWELICVDDGSTDDSVAVIRAIAATEPRLRLIEAGRNEGPGPARNRGIAAARGRFIAFLDCDDLWHPEKLARQIPWMKAEGHALSYTAYTRLTLATGARVVVGVPDRVTRAQLLHTNVIGCSTAIYDRSTFGERRMPDLRRRQDFAFWLALLADVPAAAGLNLALTTYRQRGASVSSAKGAAARDTWAMYRGHLGLSAPRAAWVFVNYALRGLLRHRAPALARRLGILREARLPD